MGVSLGGARMNKLTRDTLIKLAKGSLMDAVDNITNAAKSSPLELQESKLLCAIAQSLAGLLAMDLAYEEEVKDG